MCLKSVYSFVIIILIFLFLLTGCVLSEFGYYENFFDDMDISARMQDYIAKASNNDTSAFFLDELKTFKEDLLLSPKEAGEDAENVNAFFLEATDYLIEAVLAGREGEKEIAQQLIDSAILCYNEGSMRYQDFIVKYN